MSVEDIRYLDRKMIMDILPVSRSTLIKLEKSDYFPKPVFLFGGSEKPFWKKTDLKKYLDELHE